MQRRNGFWRDAALCGLIIGAVSIAVSFLKALPFAPANIVFSLTELVAIIWCLYKFGKRRAMLGDPMQGYSFGQNMGFVVAVMLVAGFIYGVGEYLQVNFIVSGMVDKVGEEMIERAYRMHGNNAMAAADLTYDIIKSPFYWIFIGIASMIIKGGIVGLFVTPFVTRRPEPQNTQHDEQQA